MWQNMYVQIEQTEFYCCSISVYYLFHPISKLPNNLNKWMLCNFMTWLYKSGSWVLIMKLNAICKQQAPFYVQNPLSLEWKFRTLLLAVCFQLCWKINVLMTASSFEKSTHVKMWNFFTLYNKNTCQISKIFSS